MNVILDPGHMTGTASQRQLGGVELLNGHGCEADYALGMGRQILAHARALGLPVQLRLSRERNDQIVSWDERIALSRGADALVALHVNDNIDTRLHGCFVLRGRHNTRATAFADAIMGAMPLALRGERAHSTYAHPTYWPDAAALLERYARVPQVALVEIGFGRNEGDVELLTTDPIKYAVSVAVCQGLIHLWRELS